jgi:hypothetical protein
MAAEEIDRVESDVVETGRDLEFWDESETTLGGLLFIGLKILAVVLD